MNKYEPLTTYLRKQPASELRISFVEIERVIGTKLPKSAVTHRAWWSNNPQNNVMTRAWLNGGFETEQVDLERRSLVFRRKPSAVASRGPSGALSFSTPTPDKINKTELFGWMKGTFRIEPGVDLTAPADPEWGDSLDDGQ